MKNLKVEEVGFVFVNCDENGNFKEGLAIDMREGGLIDTTELRELAIFENGSRENLKYSGLRETTLSKMQAVKVKMSVIFELVK